MRNAVSALIRKDLLLQRRTPEAVPAMVLFSIGTFVLFHFALDERVVSGNLASGILWVTLLFAAGLGINRLFVFLATVDVFVVAAFAILLLGPSPWPGLPSLALVFLLADVGLAVIGTLVAALAVQTRARDLLVPLLALPLSVPLVIAGARACEPLLAADGAGALEARWLGVLGLYDLVFGLLAYAIFDFLLEE